MNPGDRHFIQLAIQLGFLTQQQISLCLKQQQQLLKNGQTVSLQQILMHCNYLNTKQIAIINERLTNPSITNVPQTNSPTTGTNFVAPSPISRTMFQRYEECEEIGRGGMGVVYKAKDIKLKRIVALKVIKEPSASGEFNTRFKREALVMAKLKHPGVIDIYDIGEYQGEFYFTMEYIEGQNLEQLLKSKLSIAQWVGILIKVLAAVQYTHQNGVIHRDLKPSNILITSENFPKVLDFGLAKDISDNEKLSQSGQLIGTVKYMSPEQANCDVRSIDAQSDIYSLGAILYHILVGRAPFSGTRYIDILQKILLEEPTLPSKIHPTISRDLEAICLKALEKRKQDRYRSAQEMAQDLQNYLEGKSVSAQPVTQISRFWRWIRRHRIVSITSAGIIIAFVTMWIIFSVRLNRSYHKVTEQNLQLNSLNTELANQRNIAVEKQSEARLVLARNHLMMARLHTKNKTYHQAKTQQLQAQNILTTLESELKYSKYPSLFPKKWSKVHQKIEKAKQISQYFSQYQISPHLIKKQKMQAYPLSNSRHFPTQNPSRNFWALYKTGHANILYLWSRKQNKVIATIRHSGTILYVAFNNDDRYLASGDVLGQVNIWDIREKKQSSIKLFENSERKGIHNIIFSPNNKLLFCGSAHSSVLIEIPSLRIKHTFEKRGSKRIRAQFSPDSNKIAIGGRKNNTLIWEIMANSHKVKPFGKTVWEASSALCFSPDGEKLAYSMDQDIAIWDFAKQSKVILKHGHKNTVPTLNWSEDSRLLVSAGWDNRMVIWDVHSGSKIAKLTLDIARETFNFIAVAFYPGQRKLALWDFQHFVTYDISQLQIKKFDLTTKFPEKKKELLAMVRSFPPQNLYTRYLSLTIAPNQKYIAYHILYKTFLWDIERDTGYLLVEDALYAKNDFKNMLFSPDSSLLVEQGKKWLRIWDVQNRKLILRKPHKETAGHIKHFHPKGWLVMLSDKGSQLIFVEIAGRQMHIRQKMRLQNFLNVSYAKVAFDAQGKLMAVARYKLQIYNIDKEANICIYNYTPPIKSDISAISFTGTSNQIAFGSSSGELVIWNWKKNKPIQKFQLQDHIRSLHFDPDEQFLWVITSSKILLYKIPIEKQELSIYPLQLYPDHTMFQQKISINFKYLAYITPSFSVLLFNLNKTTK